MGDLSNIYNDASILIMLAAVLVLYPLMRYKSVDAIPKKKLAITAVIVFPLIFILILIAPYSVHK